MKRPAVMQLTHGGRALTEGIVHSSGDHVQRRLSHLGHPASNQSPRPRLNLWETHKCSKHVEGKAKQHVANTGLIFFFFQYIFFWGCEETMGNILDTSSLRIGL